jgi:hypothetical protein
VRSASATVGFLLGIALTVAACSGSGMPADGGPDGARAGAGGGGTGGAGGAAGTAGGGGMGGAAGGAGTGGSAGGGSCTSNPAGDAQCTMPTLTHFFLCTGGLVPARCAVLYVGDVVTAYCCP